MHTHIYPTDLTDRQWHRIKPLIPLPRPGGRPRTVDMRHLINAILFLVVTGAVLATSHIRFHFDSDAFDQAALRYS